MRNLKKVLVVDDFRLSPVLLAKYLDRSGFATHTASNGREMLISDAHLPGMNGFELTRRVREISDIPIVIMSAGSGYMEDG